MRSNRCLHERVVRCARISGLTSPRRTEMLRRAEELPMTETELSAALDRWGTNLAAWPANEATQARTLLARSAEARERFAEALAIARLIDKALPATSLDVP